MTPITIGARVEYCPTHGHAKYAGAIGEVTGFFAKRVLVKFDDGAELLVRAKHLTPMLTDKELRDEKRELRRRHFAEKRAQTEV